MGNVRELLSSRMGPTTVNFDTGRGGKPDLTNQDIAAALGMVPQGLGRELLEACWWPDAAARRSHKLRDAVIALVEPEFRRQQQALSEARINLGLAEICMGWAGHVTHQQRQAKQHAARELEAVKAGCWPNSTLDSLATLAGAAIAEIAERPICRGCQGAGKRELAQAVLICPECDGAGIAGKSDRRRAAAIGRDESTYRSTWRPVYEWIYERMEVAESDAAKRLQAALGHCAA
ncbi:MAG TPA: hypothetical protein VES70_27760 [Pseudomonas sp.]|nr:hypothetical protein [Pseudomonas sp.]